jgi:hypothetical protein
MSREKLKDANLECNNKKGKADHEKDCEVDVCYAVRRGQGSKTPNLSATISRQGSKTTSSATMSGAISKDANLECYYEHGKTQKMPTLS